MKLNKYTYIWCMILFILTCSIPIRAVASEPEIVENKYELTSKEIETLCRLVESEAQGLSISAKQNVASVVLNRYENDLFPDDLIEVIKQKNQFYYNPNIKISDDTRIAVANVLRYGSTAFDALFFLNPDKVSEKTLKSWNEKYRYLFYDEGHSYFTFYE